MPHLAGFAHDLFTGTARGKAFGWMGITFGLGGTLGPPIGGLLVWLGGPVWGWRLVFLINLPLGMLIVWAGLRWFPPGIARHARRTLDVVGGVLVGAVVVAVLLPIVEYASMSVATTLAWWGAGLGRGVGFGWWERRLKRLGRQPLVNPELLRQPSFTVGLGIAFCYLAATNAIPLLLAVFFQTGRGMSALQAGMVMVPWSFASAIGGLAAGRFLHQRGRQVVTLGLTVLTVGFGAMLVATYLAPADAPWLAITTATLFVAGLGGGAVLAPNQAVSLLPVTHDLSTASGVLQTGQRLGTSVGLALAGTVFYATLRAHADVATGPRYLLALRHGVWLSLGLMGCALVLALVDVWHSRARMNV